MINSITAFDKIKKLIRLYQSKNNGQIFFIHGGFGAGKSFVMDKLMASINTSQPKTRLLKVKCEKDISGID